MLSKLLSSSRKRFFSDSAYGPYTTVKDQQVLSLFIVTEAVRLWSFRITYEIEKKLWLQARRMTPLVPIAGRKADSCTKRCPRIELSQNQTPFPSLFLANKLLLLSFDPLTT